MAGSESVRRPEALVKLLAVMREWAAGNVELHHHLGVRMGLPHTDADAFGQIVWAVEAGEPLSPSSLSRRVGITSGATTALLRRLESRELIERLRDPEDGRRVVLRPTPHGRDQLLAFVESNGSEIDEVLQWQSAETIDTVTCFVLELAAAGRRANTRLRAQPGVLASTNDLLNAGRLMGAVGHADHPDGRSVRGT